MHYPKLAINLENIFKISKISIFEGIFLEVIHNNLFLLLENIVITSLYYFTLFTYKYSKTFKYQILLVAKIFFRYSKVSGISRAQFDEKL